MVFDVQPLKQRLDATQAERKCLSCGSSNINFDTSRYALIEVGSDDNLAIESSWELVSTLRCMPRVCEDCSFVHLYSLNVIDRWQENPV
jgi:hypothetical protein